MLVMFTEPNFMVSLCQDEAAMLVEDILERKPASLHTTTIALLVAINNVYKSHNNCDISPLMSKWDGPIEEIE